MGVSAPFAILRQNPALCYPARLLSPLCQGLRLKAWRYSSILVPPTSMLIVRVSRSTLPDCRSAAAGGCTPAGRVACCLISVEYGKSREAWSLLVVEEAGLEDEEPSLLPCLAGVAAAARACAECTSWRCRPLHRARMNRVLSAGKDEGVRSAESRQESPKRGCTANAPPDDTSFFLTRVGAWCRQVRWKSAWRPFDFSPLHCRPVCSVSP